MVDQPPFKEVFYAATCFSQMVITGRCFDNVGHDKLGMFEGGTEF
jgi:hypothetical protein